MSVRVSTIFIVITINMTKCTNDHDCSFGLPAVRLLAEPSNQGISKCESKPRVIM